MDYRLNRSDVLELNKKGSDCFPFLFTHLILYGPSWLRLNKLLFIKGKSMGRLNTLLYKLLNQIHKLFSIFLLLKLSDATDFSECFDGSRP